MVSIHEISSASKKKRGRLTDLKNFFLRDQNSAFEKSQVATFDTARQLSPSDEADPLRSETTGKCFVIRRQQRYAKILDLKASDVWGIPPSKV